MTAFCAARLFALGAIGGMPLTGAGIGLAETVDLRDGEGDDLVGLVGPVRGNTIER